MSMRLTPSRLVALRFGGCLLSGHTSAVNIHIQGDGCGEVTLNTFIKSHADELRAKLAEFVGFYDYFELRLGPETLTGKETRFDSYEAAGSDNIMSVKMRFVQELWTPGFYWARA